MISDARKWREWEENGPLREPVDIERNFRIAEGLYEHARALGVFPPADPLEGLENNIQLARVLNGKKRFPEAELAKIMEQARKGIPAS